MAGNQDPNLNDFADTAGGPTPSQSEVSAKEVMKSRRKAREAALQALYQCDALENHTAECVDLFFSNFYPEISLVLDEPEHGSFDNPEHRQFARALVDAALLNQSAIDDLIGSASKNWSLSRMARVDRNILRLAAAELLYFPEVPVGVTINEAIELAKLYGTEETPQFVNGILDQIARLTHAAEKKLAAEKRIA